MKTSRKLTINEVIAQQYLQTIPLSVLVSAVRGTIDLNAGARRELAARGRNSSGDWVGFEQAERDRQRGELARKRVQQLRRRTAAKALMLFLAFALQGCDAEEVRTVTATAPIVVAAEPSPTPAVATVATISALSVRRVTATQGALVAVVSCANDEVMTGGGCECLDNQNSGRLKSQVPQGNGMRCQCVDQAAGDAVAYALCMKPTFVNVLDGS